MRSKFKKLAASLFLVMLLFGASSICLFESIVFSIANSVSTSDYIGSGSTADHMGAGQHQPHEIPNSHHDHAPYSLISSLHAKNSEMVLISIACLLCAGIHFCCFALLYKLHAEKQKLKAFVYNVERGFSSYQQYFICSLLSAPLAPPVR